MARSSRVEYPSAFYHVINRGIAGDDIFKSPHDREKFLVYLQTAAEHYGLKIHTYCLMTNIITCWLRPQRRIKAGR
jgi:REP element-mobilizing transposase RayT